ncbi:9071_t:CDS:2 [Gigaspora margarita]|uniref:9071_t:CDS:1 n=1 Tax=Gigaspora margarita TaxID=4874 RepID=A0ABN7VYX0_GIGMA|nr:9071_t:CDS:2 [Gigaspora margarita]
MLKLKFSDGSVDLNGQDSDSGNFADNIERSSIRVNGLKNGHTPTSNGKKSQNNGRYNGQARQPSNSNLNSCSSSIPNSQAQVLPLIMNCKRLDVPFPFFSEQFTQFQKIK